VHRHDRDVALLALDHEIPMLQQRRCTILFNSCIYDSEALHTVYVYRVDSCPHRISCAVCRCLLSLCFPLLPRRVGAQHAVSMWVFCDISYRSLSCIVSAFIAEQMFKLAIVRTALFLFLVDVPSLCLCDAMLHSVCHLVVLTVCAPLLRYVIEAVCKYHTCSRSFHVD